MRRTLPLVLLVVLPLVTFSPAPAADEPFDASKRGAFTATFTERSPLSDLKEMTKTFQWRPDKVDIADYDVKEARFRVYVPKDYEHGQPYGLIVFMDRHRTSQLPGGYRAIADEHRLLAVGADQFPKDHKINQTYGLVLDATHNMLKHYTIDRERVYLVGHDGGGSYASRLALTYPQYFRGGFYMFGVDYFRLLPNPEEPNKQFGPSFPAPAGNASRLLRTSRFVVLTAKTSNGRAKAQSVFKEGYQKDRLGYSEFIELDAVPRGHAPAEAFKRGLMVLDKPLAAGAKRLFSKAERDEETQDYEDAWAGYTMVAGRAGGTELGEQAASRIERLRQRRAEDVKFISEALTGDQQEPAKQAVEQHRRKWGALAHPAIEAIAAGKSPAEALAMVDEPRAGGEKPAPAANEGDAPADDAGDDDAPADAGDANDSPRRTGPASRDELIEKFAARKLDAAKKVLDEDLIAGFDAMIQVAEQYKDTDAGAEAKKIVDAINADEAKRKKIELVRAQAKAVRVLSLAKRYLRAENYKKTREILSEIVKEYPGTEAAKEAGELLKEIEGKG